MVTAFDDVERSRPEGPRSKPCDACGDRIAAGQVEYQVDLPDSEMTLRVHPECLALWYEQCAKDSRKISGGSAPQPSTLFFDLPIGRHAGRARALHEELLAATAETRAIAAQRRALSRSVRAARPSTARDTHGTDRVVSV